MLISHKYKFIFVHIQKTAGSSLTKAFKELDDSCIDCVTGNANSDKHIYARNLKYYIQSNYLPPQKF